MKTHQGFTLLELLITLSLSALLISLTIPSFTKTIQKHHIDSNMSKMHKFLNYARSYALDQNTDVHICGSNDSVCAKEWSNTLFIFVDKNNNNEPDEEEILKKYSFDLELDYIKSRLATGSKYTVFKPQGNVSWTGSFIYCPNDNKEENFRRVTWNRVGRSYRGRDTNGDGIIEDRNGEVLACRN